MSKCSFKLSHFKEILERAKELGYVFTTFRDYEKVSDSNRLIILRHDIDYSITRALEIAKIESDLNIKATYFVRLHSKDYNPFEFKVYIKLREIVKLGHELGLHFEALDVSHITAEDEINVFKREKTILENILNQPVYTAAQHGDFTGVSRNWNSHFFRK